MKNVLAVPYMDEFKNQVVQLYNNGKRNKHFKMENDIRKQAALILECDQRESSQILCVSNV